jgi:hypothetical protein
MKHLKSAPAATHTRQLTRSHRTLRAESLGYTTSTPRRLSRCQVAEAACTAGCPTVHWEAAPVMGTTGFGDLLSLENIDPECRMALCSSIGPAATNQY